MSATIWWRTTSAPVRWTKASWSMPVSTRSRPFRPDLPSCTSTCVSSPVTTTFDPKPMRVRNIFICSGVVFCASSRMMKLLFKRAATHERQRRDLDRAALEQRLRSLRIDHVVERVVERPQVGIDLGHQVAGQEAEPLAGLDRRAGEDDPLHLTGLQRLHGHRHRQPRLAGAGGPDAERDDVVADRFDVALLAGGLGSHLAPLGAAQHLVGEHLGRSLVGAHHADRAVDRALVELVAALEQPDQFLEQAGRRCSVSPPRIAISLPRTVDRVSGKWRSIWRRC